MAQIVKMQANLAHALDDFGPSHHWVEVSTPNRLSPQAREHKRGRVRVDIKAQVPLQFVDHNPGKGYRPQTRPRLRRTKHEASPANLSEAAPHKYCSRFEIQVCTLQSAGLP